MNNDKRDEKALTEQEKKRLAKYNKKKDELIKAGYEEHDLTVCTKIGNTVSFLTGLPIIGILVLIYWLVGNSFEFADYGLGMLAFILLSLFFASTVIHELIHGITYAVFAKNGFKDIEFGIIWQSLNPYCTCGDALKKYQYLLALFMPCFVLGIIPSIIAIFNGSLELLLWGLYNILAASGDLLIIYLVLTKSSKKKETLYHDHPTEIGVVMFDK